MKIHLRQIPAAGLHVEGEEECPLNDLAGAEVRCVGPLQYALDVGISEGALWASGSLSQPVELECVVCLGRFRHTINVPAFALHTELSGPEVIDLTPYFREDILLNLPAYPRCDRDGGRVCAGAAISATSDAGSGDAQRKAEADWSALDKLKL